MDMQYMNRERTEAGRNQPNQSQTSQSFQSSQSSQSPKKVATPVFDVSAPLMRQGIDKLIKPLRWFGGCLMVGLSATATVTLFADDISPATMRDGQQIILSLPFGLLPIAFNVVLGVCFALVIFLLEILWAERLHGWYIIVVGIDSWYTQRQIQPWINAIFYTKILSLSGNVDSEFVLGWLITHILGWAIGFCVAYFGEILLFGRRRSFQQKQKMEK